MRSLLRMAGQRSSGWWPLLLLTVTVMVSVTNGTYYLQDHDSYYQYHLVERVKRADEQPTTTSATTSSASTLASSTGQDKALTRGWQKQSEQHILENIDIPEQKINESISTHAKEIGDNVTMDNYKYYSYKFVSYDRMWVDLDHLNSSGQVLVQEHKMLSKSYRRAATIKLNFRFPFYGHWVENITIATGGFLYTGEYVHSWLAATQYIAPLMANFDTSQDEEAKIRYADNGTALIVEWKNVYLQTQDPGEKSGLEGPFTFQVTIHSNGDIVFAYKEVPIKITTIEHKEHPVKVGLSDAYIIDRTIFFVRRKTIYEYHRVNMKETDITNSTAIYLKALPTCNLFDSCKTCLDNSANGDNELRCQWCPSVMACSDGMDRKRQIWMTKSCDNKKFHLTSQDVDKCSNVLSYSNVNAENTDYLDHSHSSSAGITPEQGIRTNEVDVDDAHNHLPFEQQQNKGQAHHLGMAALSIILVLLLTVCGWFVYAYFCPHSWSGQLLIKYRPSSWHWRRGEPRYTAASIHM